jgi:hypothetical protein
MSNKISAGAVVAGVLLGSSTALATTWNIGLFLPLAQDPYGHSITGNITGTLTTRDGIGFGPVLNQDILSWDMTVSLPEGTLTGTQPGGLPR